MSYVEPENLNLRFAHHQSILITCLVDQNQMFGDMPCKTPVMIETLLGSPGSSGAMGWRVTLLEGHTLLNMEKDHNVMKQLYNTTYLFMVYTTYLSILKFGMVYDCFIHIVMVANIFLCAEFAEETYDSET